MLKIFFLKGGGGAKQPSEIAVPTAHPILKKTNTPKKPLVMALGKKADTN